MAANTSGATQLDMLMDDRATYALIKAFVPKHLQQHCPDSFLNCAVVSKHEDDEQLRLQFPNTYDATFIIPPCHRRSDFHSRNSIVNKLHDSVPEHIFVAMMEGGIIDLLEGQPVDTWKQRWCEDSS